jgi:hypothetical protein
MKIRERSKHGAGSVRGWALRLSGSRPSLGTPLRTRYSTVITETLRSLSRRPWPHPPSPGGTRCHFLHRPHNVADWIRATLRRANLDERPCSIHLPYLSANGLSPEATAEHAAPRIVPLSRRWARVGTPRYSGPLPLCFRSSPTGWNRDKVSRKSD